MQARLWWIGLGSSPFLADVTPGDRDARRLLLTLVVGFGVGWIAVNAAALLVEAPYTLLAGLGGEGLHGLAVVRRAVLDPSQASLDLTLLRVTMVAADGVFMLAFVAVAAALSGKRLMRYVSAAPTIRWRLLLVGLAITALALAPAVAAERLSDPHPSALPVLSASSVFAGRAMFLFSTLLLIPAAAAEELMFRGWLLRHLASLTRRPMVLMAVTGLIFSALHLDFTPVSFITRAVMGMGLAYMTLRLGGVELAVGAHAANNILIVIFLQPLLGAESTSGGLDLIDLFEEVALVASYVAITEAIARIPALRRLTGVEEAQLSPSASLSLPLG